MTITPDTKDWTWVLDRTCPECRFDVQEFPPDYAGLLIRQGAERMRTLLNDRRAGTRPSPDVWSGLEYACHVRDVFRLYEERLIMMLDQDDPLYPNWDQDETAVRDKYEEQDPERVGLELEEASESLASRFDALDDHDWMRKGRRSDGATFTVESFARYLIHDLYHHIHDVERGYEKLEGSDERRR